MSEPQDEPEIEPGAQENGQQSELESGADGVQSPYRDLWVPLVVVPALIVVGLVLVFVFFGAITGSEASLSDNLRKVVEGGANERQQAAFNLARQIAENSRAADEQREAPWTMEEGFLQELSNAWNRVSEKDYALRHVLAYAQAYLGDSEGLPRMMTLLELDELEDPGGDIRFATIANLGALADQRAADRLIQFLDDEDPGLRSGAAIALQAMPVELVRGALRASLSDDDFDVRANAAISLSHMDDDACADLLLELCGLEAYAIENKNRPERYFRAGTVRDSRVKAIQALGRLKRAEDKGFLRGLEDDSDLLVREAAMRASRIGGWEPGD